MTQISMNKKFDLEERTAKLGKASSFDYWLLEFSLKLE